MHQSSPEILFIGALSGEKPADLIMASERAGQAALCSGGDVVELPTDISGEDRLILLAFGVTFLGAIKGDPLFQRARLPDGWKIAPTDHSMWSNLLDSRGAKRAAIFYKAAFYDRSAHLRVEPRFVVKAQYPCPPIGQPRTATITDAETGEILFTASEIVPDPTYKSNPDALCRRWLDENRPDHIVNRGWTLPAAQRTA